MDALHNAGDSSPAPPISSFETRRGFRGSAVAGVAVVAALLVAFGALVAASELLLPDRSENRYPEMAIKEGAHDIAVRINEFAADNGRCPAVAEVVPGGPLESPASRSGTRRLTPWPEGPDGTLMHPGHDFGDYEYTTDGATYTLSFHLRDDALLTIAGEPLGE